MGNARLLLRLADAAGHLVVDGLVMGGFSAQQAAKCHDGVHLATVGDSTRGGGYLPGAWNAHHVNVGPIGAATQQGVQRSLQQPLGDDRIPACNHDGKPHPEGNQITLYGHRLAPQRIGPCPETVRETPLRLDGENARLPVRFLDGRQAYDGLVSALRAKPS